jgi:hypothetical protein
MDFRVRLGLAGRAQTTAIASYREDLQRRMAARRPREKTRFCVRSIAKQTTRACYEPVRMIRTYPHNSKDDETHITIFVGTAQREQIW